MRIFLFAGLVLLYFTVLLRCLRADRLSDWFILGTVHGLAFLTKAFGLPWLSICTAVAVSLLSNKSWQARAARFALAAIVPLITAAGWATVLHSKYGVYTTGSQFRTNLLQWNLGAFRQHHDPPYGLLRNTLPEADEYTVDDPMPPGSWAWTYRVSVSETVPKLIAAEKRNTPSALKELFILATPGGVLAFFWVLTIITAKKGFYPIEWRLIAVIATGGVTLIFAYCMLVFDGRYLVPLIPLVIAVAARFLVAEPSLNHSGWRRISTVLVVFGVVVSFIYPASPYRVLTRDFQTISYEAGALLRQRRSASLVGIGCGPFPEHGVGWEAAYQSAYFGDARLIGTMESLPDAAKRATLTADIGKASPDAILVWGTPADSRYNDLIRSLAGKYPNNSIRRIDDPTFGEAGTILFTRGPS
jgi:4-amino-4-deoxy-L-arabinose transferase-like glycosyltransferase